MDYPLIYATSPSLHFLHTFSTLHQLERSLQRISVSISFYSDHVGFIYSLT